MSTEAFGVFAIRKVDNNNCVITRLMRLIKYGETGFPQRRPQRLSHQLRANDKFDICHHRTFLRT
jgi:hypothetical protein